MVGMAVDNTIYERTEDIWWGDDQPLTVIRTALNPARLAYFRHVFTTLGTTPAGRTVLDVGCGGGLLSEELAGMGAAVIGVDPADGSLQTARRHAEQEGFDIDYRRGAGESLPVDDASVDIVCCVDVLEHVQDLDAVLRETARVLRPGGLYLFDTVNRTRLSRLVMIKLCQDWPRTGWMPPDLHDWAKFITPDELRTAATGAGLSIHEITGMAPGVQPPRLYLLLRQLKKGRITHAEFGRRTEFRLTPDLRVTYIGYATKAR
jgi:2-polyprenyl-6-hydroxyphenyl methylase/3-demethylubiquinone-9 3-methyltransferase